MLQQTDIVGHLVRTCRNTCQYIQYSGVHLTGVSLTGYRYAFLKAHLLSDHRIDLVDGLLISVKELQETCLGSCGSLGSQQLHAI